MNIFVNVMLLFKVYFNSFSIEKTTIYDDQKKITRKIRQRKERGPAVDST